MLYKEKRCLFCEKKPYQDMVYNIIQSSLHLFDKHKHRMVDSLTVHGAELWVEGVEDSSYLLPVSDSLRSESQLHIKINI